MDNAIFVVDAYSQIFRWFYAMPLTFRTKEGQPVNAIFGIGKFLFQLHKQYAPCGGAFAFDLGGSKLRLEEHPEYKSNRTEMPEELRCQIEPIQELIAAFGWTLLSAEGYEADDIIATLVARFHEHPFRIITADKDISQLIDDSRVTILSPNRSGGGFSEWDEKYIIEKHGVPPVLIPDYLALVGDAVDFINGIQGIGPKTAAAIVSTIGALEPYLENPTACKWQDKLLENKALILRNLRLIRLNGDVPNLPDAPPPAPKMDIPKLREIFERYELRSLLKELDAVAGAACAPEIEAVSALPELDPDDLFGAFEIPLAESPVSDKPQAMTSIAEDDFFGDML